MRLVYEALTILTCCPRSFWVLPCSHRHQCLYQPGYYSGSTVFRVTGSPFSYKMVETRPLNQAITSKISHNSTKLSKLYPILKLFKLCFKNGFWIKHHCFWRTKSTDKPTKPQAHLRATQKICVFCGRPLATESFPRRLYPLNSEDIAPGNDRVLSGVQIVWPFWNHSFQICMRSSWYLGFLTWLGSFGLARFDFELFW